MVETNSCASCIDICESRPNEKNDWRHASMCNRTDVRPQSCCDTIFIFFLWWIANKYSVQPNICVVRFRRKFLLANHIFMLSNIFLPFVMEFVCPISSVYCCIRFHKPWFDFPMVLMNFWAPHTDICLRYIVFFFFLGGGLHYTKDRQNDVPLCSHT